MRDFIHIRPSMREIAQAVADQHGVTLADIRGVRCDRPLVAARHAAIYACWLTGLYNKSQIGRYFGGRDPRTAMHAIRRASGESYTQAKRRRGADAQPQP